MTVYRAEVENECESCEMSLALAAVATDEEIKSANWEYSTE